MSHLPFYAPLACTSSLLWSGVENRLLRSFGCLLIVLELLRNVPLQETLNAPDLSYKVCMHALSPVKQTNKVLLLLFSRSTAPPGSSLPPLATTTCLCQLPYLVYLILHPISHMPRPYSPSHIYTNLMPRGRFLWLHTIFPDNRARSRFALAIGPSPLVSLSSLWLDHCRLSSR
jgi:hypothetical protein